MSDIKKQLMEQIESGKLLIRQTETGNSNMPLRNLFYVSDIYSGLTKDKNLFGTKLIRIPEPKFVVFYNGLDEVPEKSMLKMSDMFENSSDEMSLELITEVFNINLGYNEELMARCKTLHDYAFFTDQVRRNQKQMPLKLAVSQAVDECITSGILADFLKTNKAEVIKMSLYEYDEEKHIQMEREDAREEGRIEGREEGELLKLIDQVRKKMAKGLEVPEIADMLEEEEKDIQKIYDVLLQSPSDAAPEAVLEKIINN